MIRTVAFLLSLVCICAVVCCGNVRGGESANLLPSPSFEKADGWKQHTWGGKAVFAGSDVARGGKRSLSITSSDGADAAWYCTVSVDPSGVYRLSGWIKTENVNPGSARGALLNLHGMNLAATRAITGSRDWTKVEVVFEAEGRDTLQVNCLLGGWGTATGKAWFDDVRLEKISTKDWGPITIDAEKRGEPVSKYIYGQFIEHLGRCIYGGIWAEMLEDRKFFYAVGDEKSPWKADGPVEMDTVEMDTVKMDTVEMDKQNSFVGEHTPRIVSPGRIAQDKLGLQKGKKYVGRIWLKGAPDAAPVRVSLVWGEGPGERQTVVVKTLDDKYLKTPLEFTAGADTGGGKLEISTAGKGSVHVGTVSLMPADNVDGFRPDTLALLRELDSPVYRWPGGNFVSGYDWKDGIGERDRRPPRKNPAWKGVEHNDVGIDEFIELCRLLKTEPYIAVNSGQGDVKNAVEELQYANGAADTPMGRLRGKNGHVEPYGVKWWGIGNEMYGDWQLGHIPLEDYIQKNNRFAQAMREEDPSIKLVAVGSVGKWSEGIMAHCAGHMDLISEHIYRGEKPGLASHVRQMSAGLQAIGDAHRRYRKTFDSLKGKDIRIALDEWNYWYGPHIFGELGTRYFLKDALGIAAGLNTYIRNSDIFFMANYAQTVNVIGCIKTSKTDASLATTGLVLKLYRKHFGEVPLSASTGPVLDVAAAVSKDGKTLTLAVVNPTMSRIEAPLQVKGVRLSGKGILRQIAGKDPMAYNEPGKPQKVSIEEQPVSGVRKKISLAPCSVTLFSLELK